MIFFINKATSLPLIEIADLESARKILNNINYEIAITNPRGSTRYIGFLVIDYIFRTLIQEYTNITEVILRTDGDNAAQFSSLKLGYIIKD